MENNISLPEELKNTFRYFPFTRHWQPIVLLIVIASIFYCTSINNEYALEDADIIHRNQHVIKGVKGIKDILTGDDYDGIYRGCGIR